MKLAAAVAIAALGFGAARLARGMAAHARPSDAVEAPYAPAPGAAPFLSLGYRELAADLMFVRLRGYFGGDHSTSRGIVALVEAIVAVDPGFHRIYAYGARAITLARSGVDQESYQRSIAVLDRGRQVFPQDWKIAHEEGQTYMMDLTTADPAQRRAWTAKAAQLLEAAARMPGAPSNAAGVAAVLQTKLGQHQAAIDNLREMLLLTGDNAARKRLLEQLAKLEHEDTDELAGELYEARKRFSSAWQHDRPTLPPSMYIVLGPRLGPGFDLTDLATGGHDLAGSQPIEQLDPPP